LKLAFQARWTQSPDADICVLILLLRLLTQPLIALTLKDRADNVAVIPARLCDSHHRSTATSFFPLFLSGLPIQRYSSIVYRVPSTRGGMREVRMGVSSMI
jgi:hypothetical protein